MTSIRHSNSKYFEVKVCLVKALTDYSAAAADVLLDNHFKALCGMLLPYKPNKKPT